MQRMYTPRFSLNSGTVDQGSAMDSGVSLPTKTRLRSKMFYLNRLLTLNKKQAEAEVVPSLSLVEVEVGVEVEVETGV